MNRRQLLSHLADLICATGGDHPLRVAVDGIDAAGKSTLAAELSGVIQAHRRPVITASIDGFHNPRAIRYRRGHDSPEGYYFDSFDYQAVLGQLLIPLGPGGDRRYRTAVYDYRTDKPLSTPQFIAPENAILLMDGIFLLREQLLEHWDLKIFVDISFSTSLERGVARDRRPNNEEAIRQRYKQRYIPGQEIYFKRCAPMEKADLIIQNDDPNNPDLKS